MNTDALITLGKTEIKVSTIGLGVMQWGDVKSTGHAGPVDPELSEIYRISSESGINFFDTAEMYGQGRSETYLGKCIHASHFRPVVASKFMPFPWRLSKRELHHALKKSLNRLSMPNIDLYQMHWPFPPVPIKTWMDAMTDAVKEGLIRAVGVSNYSSGQVEIAHQALAKFGIPLASNQVRFSLLHRQPETKGLLDRCKQLGVTLIAYSPLEKGILTGKYTPDNLPTDFRALRYNRSYLVKISPLIQSLRQIGIEHGGKTPGQVALNWLRFKGAVPIPGARHASQAQENAGAIGWQLTTNEVTRLDIISQEVIM